MPKKVRSRRRPAAITDENPTPLAQPTTEPDAATTNDGEEEDDEAETSERLSNAGAPGPGPVSARGAPLHASKRDAPNHNQADPDALPDEPDFEEEPGAASPLPLAADQSDGKDVPNCTPADLKKWRAWLMSLDGMRQKDIAEELKFSTRTIYTWLNEFKGNAAILLKNFDPEGEVVRHLFRLESHENKLREYQKKAELRSDYRTAIRCETLIGRLDDERHRYLAKLGLFDRLNLAQLVSAASGNRKDGSIHDLIEDFLANFSLNPGNDPAEET